MFVEGYEFILDFFYVCIVILKPDCSIFNVLAMVIPQP